MLLYHRWPGSGEPFHTQKATATMLTENPRAYVFNEPGTGKTRAALYAWDYLYTHGLTGKLLVVAPLSTLRFSWGRECQLVVPHRKCIVLHGTKSQRRELLAQDADIYIVNHHGVSVIANELSTRADVKCLILDELAVYRNQSDRSKFMRKFAKRFEQVWGLTGSPMPHSPTDIWSQAMIVTPGSVPEYFSRCREMLMTRKSTYVWVPKPDAVERALSMVRPAVRFTLDEVVELPELVEQTVDIEMSSSQKKVYTGMVNTLAAQVEQKVVLALNAGIARGKLVQIAGGFVYTNHPEFVTLDASERIDALVNLINESEHKVLVAVPYRHAIDGISAVLTKEKIDHCVVHGDTKNRDELLHAFQNTAQYHTMLAHPECIHHGVTLTAADTMIWYLPVDNLEVFEQFSARFRRVGQKHKQRLLMLQAAPIEKRMYARLRARQKMQESFLELIADATENT
jgi:SNF2 family DNA or RNA helicase